MVLPPVCVPRPIAACPSPTAAPDPEDEPPGVRFGSCGFRVLGPVVVAANSVVVVLPIPGSIQTHYDHFTVPTHDQSASFTKNGNGSCIDFGSVVGIYR